MGFTEKFRLCLPIVWLTCIGFITCCLTFSDLANGDSLVCIMSCFRSPHGSYFTLYSMYCWRPSDSLSFELPSLRDVSTIVVPSIPCFPLWSGYNSGIAIWVKNMFWAKRKTPFYPICGNATISNSSLHSPLHHNWTTLTVRDGTSP